MSTAYELQLMTKKRLQNLRKRSFGLQQLAVREISKQLTFYRKHPEELEKLKSLPEVLREKILQVLMKKRCLNKQGHKMEFENLKVFFPLLLSRRTRYIELSGILSFFPDRFKNKRIEKVTQWCVELLKQIETRASQVETLVINRNNPICEPVFYDHSRYAEFNKKMVQSVMKLQKLNRLNVNLFIFHLNDLLKICKKISSLQYINVRHIDLMDGVKPRTKDVIRSFRNLKELIFEWPYLNDWLGCVCTRNLANIEVVQHDPNQIMECSHLNVDENRHHALQFPGASNLRNICLDLLTDDPEAVEAMPNLFPKVTSLVVNYSMESDTTADNVMNLFNNIRHLHLLDPHSSQVVDKYLITSGQKLQSLYLGDNLKNIKIDLGLIFQYCPKLEKLSLLNVCLKKPSSKLEFFAELTELEWVFHNICTHTPDGMADPESMDLSTILSAPKLEKVKFDAKIFNQKDLLTLDSLIREKQILKNLHTLHVFLKFPLLEKDELNCLTNVLKSSCAFLPKLTDFKFGNRFMLEDPLLASQSTPLGYDIDASVCEMNYIFENEN